MKYNALKSQKSILIIGDELFEGLNDSVCMYNYCKKHLNEVLKKYSGIEENNEDFQSDYFTGKIWRKLNIAPLFLDIFDKYLCILSYGQYSNVNLDLAREYANNNNLQLMVVSDDNNNLYSI